MKVQSKHYLEHYIEEKLRMSGAGGIYDAVKSAFNKNDQLYLRDIEADLKKQVDASPKRSVEELLSATKNASFSLSRNFGAESYVPKYVRERKNKTCTALR